MLRILDFRNAKYQGETQNGQPKGLGCVLDENFTFIVSNWAQRRVVGPLAAIFQNSDKIYGDLSNKQDSLLVYTGPQCKIYKNNKCMVMDCLNSKILLKLQQRQRSSLSQSQIIQSPTIQIVAQRKYTKQRLNYYKILQQLLSTKSIQAKYGSYSQFIKYTFKLHLKNSQINQIRCIQTSKQFNLSYRKDGIYINMCKINTMNDKINVINDKIKSVGFKNADGIQEIGRRYQYNQDYKNCIVEQSINIQPKSLIEFQINDKNYVGTSILKTMLKMGTNNIPIQNTKADNKSQKEQPNKEIPTNTQRPKQFVKNIHEYYIKSLAFTNKFLNLTEIYKIRQKYCRYYEQVKEMEGGRYAQVQLQNNGYQLNQNGQPIINKQNQVQHKVATIDDWKKQRQKVGAGRSPFKKTNNIPYNQSNNQSYVPYTPTKNYENSPTKYNPEQPFRYSRQKITNKDIKQQYKPRTPLKSTNTKQTNKKPKFTYLEQTQQQNQTIRVNSYKLKKTQPEPINTKWNYTNKTMINSRKNVTAHSPSPIKFKYTDEKTANQQALQLSRTKDYTQSTRRLKSYNYN